MSTSPSLSTPFVPLYLSFQTYQSSDHYQIHSILSSSSKRKSYSISRSASDMSRIRSSSNPGSSSYWNTVLNITTTPGPSSASSRSFQCRSGCTQVFTQRSHLNQHVRAVHQGLKPFSCPDCDRSFGKKYDLTSHRDAVHNKIRAHTCPACNKAFAKRSNLVRHLKKLHNIRLP